MDISSDPSVTTFSGQERRAATSAENDELGNDKNPSGNYQSGSSTSSTGNEKEALITQLQIGYQNLAKLRLDAATWQKRVDIRKGMSVDRALRACKATIQATMDIPKSQDRPKTAGQRLPGKMPPLPQPKMTETWLAPFEKIKSTCTVNETRRAIKAVEVS